MPGIVGIIPKDHGDGGTRAKVELMVKSLRHEPFYTSGVSHDERLGLTVGWVGLPGSLSDGMPVWNETKDVGLVYYGEDPSLGAQASALKAAGHAFDPEDASAIVHLYEDGGEGCLRTLNGYFSGLLVDHRSGRALLFNDRFGLARTYYYEDDRGFYFASEAKALLRVLPELRELDPAGLAELLTYGCPREQRTVFSRIRLLPGGSKWTFRPGQPVERGTYFRFEEWEDRPRLDADSYERTFLETFPAVLERYFRGRRTVGISLTGGIDTRMIMAWAPCRPFKRPCYTFSGVYRDCADVRVAAKVARACQQRHEVLRINKDFFTEFPALAKRSVVFSDGAMDVSGAPELYMNRKAREVAPVRLTGNYGDQVVRGVIGVKPLGLRPDIFDPGFSARLEEARRTPLFDGGNPLSFFCAKQVPWVHYPRHALEASQLTVRSPFLDNDLVALAFQAPEACRDLATSLRFIAAGDPILARIPTDRGLAFPSTPLAGPVRRGIQAFTKKAEYAYDYGMPPWLTKVDRALSGLRLERLFLGRHKYYHFRIWYRRELRSYVESILLDPRTLQRPYYDGRNLEGMVRAHLDGRGNHTQEIHWVLTTELIQRNLIDKG